MGKKCGLEVELQKYYRSIKNAPSIREVFEYAKWPYFLASSFVQLSFWQSYHSPDRQYTVWIAMQAMMVSKSTRKASPFVTRRLGERLSSNSK